METIKSYASIKSARAAAKKAGVLNPVTTLVAGRYQWAAPAPDPVEPAPVESAPAQPVAQPGPVVKPKPVVKVKAPAPAKPPRVEANGVRRPKPGGLCAAVWAYLDEHGNTDLASIRKVAAEQGWSASNASIELYGWRRFNGITGRFTAAA